MKNKVLLVFAIILSISLLIVFSGVYLTHVLPQISNPTSTPNQYTHITPQPTNPYSLKFSITSNNNTWVTSAKIYDEGTTSDGKTYFVYWDENCIFNPESFSLAHLTITNNGNTQVKVSANLLVQNIPEGTTLFWSFDNKADMIIPPGQSIENTLVTHLNGKSGLEISGLSGTSYFVRFSFISEKA
jgi:hypothetical protein